MGPWRCRCSHIDLTPPPSPGVKAKNQCTDRWAPVERTSTRNSGCRLIKPQDNRPAILQPGAPTSFHCSSWSFAFPRPTLDVAFQSAILTIISMHSFSTLIALTFLAAACSSRAAAVPAGQDAVAVAAPKPIPAPAVHPSSPMIRPGTSARPSSTVRVSTAAPLAASTISAGTNTAKSHATASASGAASPSGSTIGTATFTLPVPSGFSGLGLVNPPAATDINAQESAQLKSLFPSAVGTFSSASGSAAPSTTRAAKTALAAPVIAEHIGIHTVSPLQGSRHRRDAPDGIYRRMTRYRNTPSRGAGDPTNYEQRIVFVSVLLLAVLDVALAQQAVWAQCGGIGWPGDTSCVSGTICTVLNPYFSQCIPGATAPPADANYWFSFGDSYTQTGFVDTDTLPSPGNPLGNPPYPGYTAVGGVNWIDQATVVTNHSLVLTYNYAYGGATINATLVAPYEPTVLSLIDQVNQFLAQPNVGTGDKIWTSSNALFSVWIGINDIGNSYYQSGSRDAFSDTLLDNYFELIEKLMLAQGASAQALEKSVIAGFNSKLATRVTNLTTTHSGVKTWLWDSNTAFTQVLNNPATYGFVDNTSYGGTGDFWGNNYHPSSAAQVIWGNDIGALLGDTVW
ncbi:hypothetical protein EVG20_g9187 [Dentipellis fragilis]|uniref:CBM1 domain-containing protein n=1 Tax=Dentipellis fragilis TaxID=205917 RepID=A0A4Y9XZY9_9AGAM|nr:hypothetical protein EVG20_g9187 [Dentipellis fragilis]